MSSDHVLRRAFGDAFYRRENARRATLLFCAKGVNVTVRLRRWKGVGKNVRFVLEMIIATTIALAIYGCVSSHTPSPESRMAMRAIREAYGISRVNRQNVKVVCITLDEEFTKEELDELSSIYSDNAVRDFIRKLPESTGELDKRLRELSHTGAIAKLSQGRLRKCFEELGSRQEFGHKNKQGEK